MESSSRSPAFARRPILIFWETTGACPLSCRHCRASAQPSPLPGQLDTAGAYRLLEQASELGRPRPVLVMTGGDCLSRPDLLELTGYARELGLPVALSPAVSPLLDRRRLERFREFGVRALSISLDGARAATHDAVRGATGHFEATLAAIRLLLEMGFRVQVNTTVMAPNLDELAELAAMLIGLGVPVWEVFFLIEVGRGESLRGTSAAQNEDVCHFLFDVAAHPLLVRTVEAPFFRRVVQQRRHPAADPGGPAPGPLYRGLSARLEELAGKGGRTPHPPTVGTRDGMGVIFVGHDGTVRPSGFLPTAVGDIRRAPLAQIYRHSPLLRQIRQARFSGRCGRCPFRTLCGGSRARAYAAHGDPLGEDPGCAFQPPIPA